MDDNQFIVTGQLDAEELQKMGNDMNSSRYLGYYKFRDVNYFMALLAEISPGTNFDQGDPVSTFFLKFA